MDGDISRLIKIDITLKQDEDILEILALKCIKYYVTKKNVDGKFSLLALIQDFSALN
jgi:hypothetical protein